MDEGGREGRGLGTWCSYRLLGSLHLLQFAGGSIACSSRITTARKVSKERRETVKGVAPAARACRRTQKGMFGWDADEGQRYLRP